MVETIQEKQKTVANPKEAKPPKGASLIFLLLIGIGVILVSNAYRNFDFLDSDKDGKLKLSEERQRKLDNKLKELNEAEQYALRASEAGFYPCYNCPNSAVIYLLPLEVWRYGVTTKQEKGRYGNTLDDKGLIYSIQFEGTYQACLEEEQRKIYNYALLPENLKRDTILIRPPGNKIDN